MQYRRAKTAGATYFFTVVTFKRQHLFKTDTTIQLLRQAFYTVKRCHPFDIDAIVLLPDHLHCLSFPRSAWACPSGAPAPNLKRMPEGRGPSSPNNTFTRRSQGSPSACTTIHGQRPQASPVGWASPTTQTTLSQADPRVLPRPAPPFIANAPKHPGI